MPKRYKGKSVKRKPESVSVQNDELVFPTDGQVVGYVTKVLGNARLEIKCGDGVERQARIRGAMRKKVWVAKGDLILVGLREFQDEKCDVIHKYNSNDVRKLRSYGELLSLEGSVSTSQACTEDMCVFEFDDL